MKSDAVCPVGLAVPWVLSLVTPADLNGFLANEKQESQISTEATKTIVYCMFSLFLFNISKPHMKFQSLITILLKGFSKLKANPSGNISSSA